ncbi:MAG: aldehyde dehydrogenase [Alphaproteobacteria bacterium]|nr:aldehyde dehydrogenase [Alphaproteobacteria bacterium]
MVLEKAESAAYQNYINGTDVPAIEGGVFQSVDPTRGRLWGSFAFATEGDVDHAVKAAQAAFEGPWTRLSPTRRGRLLMKWGDKIAEHAARIARIETEQNGKLYSEMHTQLKVAQDWLYYFGGLTDKIQGSVIPLDRSSVLNYTVREPLGVIGIIVPWNSPTFLTMMGVAPALAAGNTVVLKPSEVTSASAIELARLAKECGIPDGVINIVTGMRDTGEALVNHPLVAMINFTGGDAGGRAIAGQAGKHLKRCLLELGGKSPNIVFADANLDRAEAGLLSGIFAAAGQTCVAGSRAYIQQPIYDRLVARLVKRAEAIVIGDPMRAETQMGPIATKTQLEKDESFVHRAVAEGAEILCGGGRATVDGFPDGFFFEPTIIHKAAHDSFIMHTEVFGPVLTVTPFQDDEEVVALANSTPFGLAAGVWTRDINRAHTLARQLQAGTVWINTYRALAFNSPFGGYKASGIGRQNGMEAVDHYLQTKSVWCDLSNDVQDPFVIKT